MKAIGHAPPTVATELLRLDGDRTSRERAELAEEVPVALVYGGRSHAVMLCTPADLEDLAVGFTVTERIVARAADVGALRVDRHAGGIEVRVGIPAEDAARLAARARTLPGRTGCGLCGVEALADAVRAVAPVASSLVVPRAALWRAARALEAAQAWNAATHAVHAAAWCGAEGTPVVVREDVGRHNALDKALGAVWRAGLDPGDGWMLVTSRASVELVQKCAIAGVPVLAAVSRPTGLAVRVAAEAGMALVGVVRGESACVYAGEERIV